MKNVTWISNIKKMIIGAPSRRSRRRFSAGPLRIESLEPRCLLASVSFNAGAELLTFQAEAGEADVVSVSAPSADTLQIQVGGGDEIVLGGDAVGNAGFELSQTTTANDTLQIDVTAASITEFIANLGDLDDVFTATGLAGIASLFVSGEGGNDTISASALTTGVTLLGGGGGDTLTGGAGDDVLAGGGGTDVIDGGAGVDTNSFQGIGLGVVATVNADGTGTAAYGSVSEVFAGIENLTGSENNDVLVATGAAANVLRGEGGDDVLAGGGGTDVIDGGAGVDTNSFAGIGLGVTAVISADGTGTATYGAVNETFVGIENLTGSDNADNLTGNDLDNLIDGGLGDDIIVGAGGDDILFGGSGADQISGGDGNDRLVGGFGDDQLNGDAGDDSLVGNGQIEITLTNLANADGTLLTPIVVATQNGIYDQFDVGSAASENLERLAEDGTVGPRIAAALASGGVGQAQATTGGPVAPGETRTLTFFADPSDPLTQYISYASMVIPSNDAFIGNDDPTQLDLFDDEGGLIRRVGSNAFIVTGDNVYDAGTEVNDEIPENTAALAQAAPNTGVTEGGVIRQHEGFQGSERLGGAIGNVLAARPGSDFTVAGSEVLRIEIDSAARETGFSVELNNQPLASLTTDQSPAELVEEAANDRLYFNIHTTDFGGGEIRGQLLLQSDVTDNGVRTLTLAAALDSGQEPGGTSDSDATGSATVTIVVDGSTVTYSSTLNVDGITVSDLLPVAGVSSIHLHNAPAGSNGAVITDIIQGAGGDVNGNSVNALFDTGDGNVFVEALESDDDLLNGGDGNDTLSGGEGDDILRGAAGDDTILGGEGNDALNGGSGNDTLLGGQGDDFFVGIGGTDIIDGGAGIDTNSFQGIGGSVTATVNEDGTGTASYGAVTESFAGIENLTGSDNDDVLTAVGNADHVLRGLGGNDLLTGGGGNDLLLGNDGNDILRGTAGDDIAVGGSGNDSLNGGAGNDTLRGEAGDDFLVGIGGTDLIDGGAGNDINSFQGIEVGVTARINDAGSGTAQYGLVNEIFVGIEALSGSDNDDILIATGDVGRTLRGLGGDDLIVGGDGIDILIGNDGDDTIRGRGGNDFLFGNFGSDTIDGGSGDDFARGDQGDDTISGGTGNDRLAGSEGNDTLFGNDGLDFIFGASGNDRIFGGNDDDELRGGDDDDLVVGGAGFDALFGGAGTDQEIQ